MRITNQMMVNSTMANIQVNKKQVNTLETQLSTQKKINKPSEDPVIAIRALRLRSSLEQVTLYLNKNIPDADSWLKTTEGAVDEAVSVITDLYAYCEQGATDSYSPSERSTLAESLNKLRDAYYAEGDVEYAGRYLFSGYMTDTPLTYQSDETAAKADFTITQEFTRENIELKTVYTNAYSNDDILNLNVKTDAATGNVITPNVADVHRVRIGYTKVSDAGTFEIKLNDGTTIAAAAVNDSNYQPGDDEAAFNAATGEILLGENVYKQLYASDGFSFTYRKDNFAKGDLNPVMYYDCVDNNPDNAGVVYTKKTEDIEYNINFSQKLKVNTEANEVFNMYLGRDIDDLITSVNNVIDIEEGALLYQIVAMYDYELRIFETDNSGNAKRIGQGGPGKSIPVFLKKYCNGTDVYECGLELFEDINQHEHIIRFRNDIAHMRYMSNQAMNIMSIVSNIYKSFFVYDTKLKKSISLVFKNILMRYGVIADLVFSYNNKNQSNIDDMDINIINIKNLKSDKYVYKIVNEDIVKQVEIEIRNQVFLEQLHNLLYFSR